MRWTTGLACLAFVQAVGSSGKPGEETPRTNLCRLVLPERIPAVVGHEVNIYFDNVVLALPGRVYLFDVTCPKGRQQEERWTFTPQAGDVGEHPLRLAVRDPEYRLLAQAETVIRVVPA
ncbi:MAG: hypothetical protein QHJ73_19915, partial [Armatimonadota bacterium]|nr:hypothetical protein [Armatimonadota bacterium]